MNPEDRIAALEQQVSDLLLVVSDLARTAKTSRYAKAPSPQVHEAVLRIFRGGAQ